MINFLAIYMYHRNPRRWVNLLLNVKGQEREDMHQNYFNKTYLVQKCMKLDEAYSVTDFTNPSSMTYSDPISGTVNSSSMFTNPSRSFTASDQFPAKISSAPATELANHFLLWDNVTSVESVRSHDESVEYPIYDEIGCRDSTWNHTASLNDNYTLAAIGNGYDIWKPIPPSVNDNSIVPPLDNNFVSPSQMLPLQLPQSQMQLTRMLSPQILQPQVVAPQALMSRLMSSRALLLQASLTRMLPLQIISPQMLPSQIRLSHMLPSQISQPQVLSSQSPQQQVLTPQVSQPQLLLPQISQAQSTPLKMPPSWNLMTE
ncbi:unnamed protein product [Onchocerca flexuosa]|uniref:Ovule protein n=1 Tax=Onchocerca flexuosa TaxID=387005 RepID=A0A183I116_9BILA|nr:unnamed protein product [Onchocerca flexuosa]